MEYRALPRGNENERFSVIGMGTGGLQSAADAEIEAIVERAVAGGINFFDMCAGGRKVYAPFGKAVESVRDRVFMQLHFGAVYNDDGEYGWSRDLDTIKRTFSYELDALRTDHADLGFLHCVDDDNDIDELINNGILAHICELKEQGVVKHIGFSSHTPRVAERLLDTGLMDMMMFSINPAYDFEKGDEYGIGSSKERAALFCRCEREKVGISVMKPFFAGQLLSAEHSPFGKALTHAQCIQYALDRPAVLTVVPGVRTLSELETLLAFSDMSDREKDYSVIGQLTAKEISGVCVYCDHCLPCPSGIDIGLVNKYYDLASAGDNLAADHYTKLTKNADDCIECGHCEERCPFSVRQMSRMRDIAEYFRK